MGNLFSQLLAILTLTLNTCITGFNKTTEGFGLLKQYVDAKFAAVNVTIGGIGSQISTAVEAAKTVLRGEISTAKSEANAYADSKIAQEVVDRDAAIAVVKGQGEAFATSLVNSATTSINGTITTLANNTNTAITDVNSDLTATKARISAIETSDAGSADDFLPYTIQSGTTTTVQAALTTAAQELSVTTEGDRTYLLLFRGGGGSQTLTMPNLAEPVEGQPHSPTINYSVNAGEKMRVKLSSTGQIQYVIHIEDPYAEDLASVEYGITQINLSMTAQNNALTTAVTSLSSTVSQLAAALASATSPN